jgi:hypothetical protein
VKPRWDNADGDTADALEGYQETVAGIYAAHATLLARARLLRDPSSTHYVTRSVYECQMLGSFRGMTAEEYGLRDDLYSDSHIIARLYETGLTWGWLYPPVFSLPPPDVFVDSNSLIIIVAASYPSLGEEPGGFAGGGAGAGGNRKSTGGRSRPRFDLGCSGRPCGSDKAYPLSR